MLLAPIFNSLVPAAAGTADRFDFLPRLLGLSGDNQFARIAWLLVVFSALKGLFRYFAEYGMSYTGQGIVAELRRLNSIRSCLSSRRLSSRATPPAS